MNQINLLKAASRSSHLCFMNHCWNSMEKFIIGLHTEGICNRIDQAFRDYSNRKSTYLSIAVHPRAGKSQIVSKYLPPHFLGEYPGSPIILTTYSQDQALIFSSQAASVIKSDEYKELYNDVKIQKDAAKYWSVKSPRSKQEGEVHAASLYAGLAGKGATLAILDDYCKNREDAESFTIREKAWNSFTNDFMTRLAPVHIVIILATPWNVDDIRGRIKEHMKTDSSFPKFEFIDYPARARDYEGEGKYLNEFLFQERYDAEWYKNMYAILGTYAAASLMDCSPIVRGGNILSTGSIVRHKDLNDFPTRIKYARIWDLGHKVKKRGKKQADPTGGTLLGFRKIGMNTELKIPIVELWVKNYSEFRLGAPQRDKTILSKIYEDGPAVDLVLESTTDSIDTVNQLSAKLRAVKRVHKLNVTKGKDVRISPLEGVFEAGNVHILDAPWNDRWIKGIEEFDGSGSTHDEMIDNMSSGYEHLVWKGKIPKSARW